MTTHTPGPWHVEDDTAVYSNASFVADCHDAGSSIGTVVEYANARLIAAAPELLAALVRFAAVPCEHHGNIHCSMVPPDAPHKVCAPCQARAAIAKARGEA